MREDRGQYLIDMFFSKLKILIGFYQVTHGILTAFSYIEWPDSLQVVATYSGIFQLNLFQIAPLHCLFPGLRVDAFGELLLILTANVTAIGATSVGYIVYKAMISRDDEKLTKIRQTKRLLYKHIFFFLYVTYLGTFSKTVNVLPLACREVCRDDKEELCNRYAKADYSIRCQGVTYNYWMILAYASTVYAVALPASLFIALWRQRRAILSTENHVGSGMEMIDGLRFLFENYKSEAWYWELIEMSRKVVLTSGVILVGQESRSYIGLAWVVAGMFGVLFCWVKPIKDASENLLMSASLAVTIVNVGIGAVSRIPAENITDTVDQHKDAAVMKILTLGANTLVIGLVIVQYSIFLYKYYQNWRKNPQWSFSCCLGLVLPLNDLQGEVRGMVGNNLMKTQLDTGGIEKPSLATAVKDSGAISFTLHVDSIDEIKMEFRKRNVGVVKNSSKKCHRSTQTKVLVLPIASKASFGSLADTRQMHKYETVEHTMALAEVEANAPLEQKKNKAENCASAKQKEYSKNETESGASGEQKTCTKDDASFI